LWCYQRSWNGQRLLVVANLSREPLAWQAEGVEPSALWRPLMGNYADAPAQPLATSLRPFEAVWWLLED
jgi:trehalose-6-phosphate hydrolase